MELRFLFEQDVLQWFPLQLFSAFAKFLAMLGDSTTHASAPDTKARALQSVAHQLDHLSLCETGAFLNFIKARPVFPRHADHFTLIYLID